MKKCFLVIFLFLTFGCKEEINDGQITSIGFIPPHEKTYTYTTMSYIGEVPITQVHTGYRWISDTTYYVTFMKIIKKDTSFRKISVSKTDFNDYNVGDYIELVQK